jgi:hypothetical protein
LAQISSSALYFRKPSLCIPPSMWVTKFHDYNYLIYDTIWGENVFHVEYLLLFSIQLPFGMFLKAVRSQQVLAWMCFGRLVKRLLFCQFLTKSAFNHRFYWKRSSNTFVKIRPVWNELFHADGQTDRRDEVNSCISQLCQRAKHGVHALKNLFQGNSATRNDIFRIWRAGLKA